MLLRFLLWGFAAALRDSDLALDVGDEICEKRLRRVMEENAKMMTESAILNKTLEEVVGLHKEADNLKVQLANCNEGSTQTLEAETATNSTEVGDFEMRCCCQARRCKRDEEGADGTRAVEVPGPNRCCKQLLGPKQQCPAAWNASASAKDCTSAEREMLDRLNQTALPSEGYVQSDCQHELSVIWDGIQNWTQKLSLHGHWIHSIHSRHLSETIQTRLFVTGFPLEDGAVGAGLFDMQAGTKLLVSGMAPGTDNEWKTREHAGRMLTHRKICSSCTETCVCMLAILG